MRQKELSHCPTPLHWDNGTIKLEAPESRDNSRDISGTITPSHQKELSHSGCATVSPVGQIAASEPDNRPFVDDPIERAAIQAEAMPVRHLRPRVAGQGQPQPGDYCGCCRGQLWWAETDTPKGWRCCRCHPPGHLQAGQFRAVAT